MSHTAGTAGRGYRLDPIDHPYRPDHRRDPGERPRCVCGAEKSEHEGRRAS